MATENNGPSVHLYAALQQALRSFFSSVALDLMSAEPETQGLRKSYVHTYTCMHTRIQSEWILESMKQRVFPHVDPCIVIYSFTTFVRKRCLHEIICLQFSYIHTYAIKFIAQFVFTGIDHLVPIGEWEKKMTNTY